MYAYTFSLYNIHVAQKQSNIASNSNFFTTIVIMTKKHVMIEYNLV